VTTYYVYGVTDSGAALSGDVKGLRDGGVSLFARQGCAAIVSELDGDRPLGTRDDLTAHHRVLSALLAAGDTVLPFRFGAALDGTDAVVTDLLTLNEEYFRSRLEALRGRVELRLKCRYVLERVLREILGDEPEIAALSRRLRGVPEAAGYHECLRLGELVARSLTRRRQDDAERLLGALTPWAKAVARQETGGDDQVLDAGFLIDEADRSAFEQRVDLLGAENAGPIRLRLTGPIPPYDFAGQEGMTWASSPDWSHSHSPLSGV
jgi:hypothetical protein